MATDYLSALNIGSGLKTTEIIDALVDAERAPREASINSAKEEKSLSISALGQVKTELTSLNANLGVIETVNGLAPVQSGASVDIEIVDANLAEASTYQIEVQALASSQTLAFSGFTSSTQSLGAGSLVISFGSWNSATGAFTADASQTDQTVTISAESESLADVRDAINNADIGVLASIIDAGDDNYNLILKSQTGKNSALRIVATETSAGSGLAGLDYSTYDASKEVVAASDATFTVDGLSVTRETNTITDVLGGITMQLRNTTSSAEIVGAEWDSDTALAAMQAFVTNVNEFRSKLSDLIRRGGNGDDSGPLAGDALTKGILSRVRRLTTDPINGYGDDPVYLASFGMKTELDGSITLDEATFKNTFDTDPQSFGAIVKNRLTTSNNNITASVIGDDWVGGSYALAITDAGAATIDGDSMTLTSGVYQVREGNADGLNLEVSNGVQSGTVYMGRSVINQFQSYLSSMLSLNNNIDYVIDRYSDKVSDYEEELVALDNQMQSLRERYVVQYSAMDSMVASLKKTEEGLANMMDAWRGMMND